MLDPSSNSYKSHLYFPSTSDDHQDSGVCSPPLWRTSPRHRSSYRSLSPSSKAQAIARGQRELMEMVSRMPESCYELSLKDLVEANANELEERKVFDEMPHRTGKQNRVVKKMNIDKWAEKNHARSVTNRGLLLKMVFPVKLGSKKSQKKKKKMMMMKKKDDDDDENDSSVTRKSYSVSPRPLDTDRSARIWDKDWWKKELSESQGSESGISSINSSSSGCGSGSGSDRRSKRRSRGNITRENNSGCLSFLCNLHIHD